MGSHWLLSASPHLLSKQRSCTTRTGGVANCTTMGYVLMQVGTTSVALDNIGCRVMAACALAVPQLPIAPFAVDTALPGKVSQPCQGWWRMWYATVNAARCCLQWIA